MSGKKSTQVVAVLKSFEKIQDEMIKTRVKEIMKVLEECEEMVRELGESDKDIKKIESSARILEEQLLKNRKVSQKIREKVKNTHDYCDAEYNQAVELKSKSKGIEEGFSKLSVDSNNLSSNINSRYRKKVDDFWKEEKRKLNKKITSSDVFYNVREHHMNREEKKFVGMEEFLEKYSSEEHDFSKIKSVLSSGSQNNLDEVVKIIKECNREVSSLEDKALETLKAFKANLGLCLDIYKAMKKLGFSVNVVPITDDGIITSYTIECTNGDNIDFTEVRLGEGGEPIINMYHKEGSKHYHDCGTKMADIKDSLNDLGIPVTDIVKNGRSVLKKKKKRMETEMNYREKGRL